jgi:fumarylacetoacetase
MSIGQTAPCACRAAPPASLTLEPCMSNLDSPRPVHPSTPLDETHDPARASWVQSAQAPGTEFPIQNLPFGVFRRRGEDEWPRVGVAIGDEILDVTAALEAGFLTGVAAEACDAPDLNGLLSLDAAAWTDLRRQVSALLATDSDTAPRAESARTEILVRQSEVDLLMPIEVGDFTDFYASIDHATNVGSMFRPDQPLLPNYKWIPIGYHGRASSVVVSGTPVRRPTGQRKPPEADAPTWGPSRLLDYELEVGAVVGSGNPMGTPIPLGRAEAHLFGICLLNDWSARDLQAWEYQPLGPFLSKSFATSVSPWIVTRDALAPYRAPARVRGPEDPSPLPYLLDPADRGAGALDLTLEVWLRTDDMRTHGLEPVRISQGNFRELYWTLAQMLTHHTSNGCNLRPGDLLGSGTVSGPTPESRGCLLERTWRGAEPLELPNGEVRRFLEDGDEVILRGWLEAPGRPRIGLGSCVGLVLPAGGGAGV